MELIEDVALSFDDVTILEAHSPISNYEDVSLRQVNKGCLSKMPVLISSEEQMIPEEGIGHILGAGAGYILSPDGLVEEASEADAGRLDSTPYDTGLKGVTFGPGALPFDIKGAIVNGHADLINLRHPLCNSPETFKMIETIGPICQELDVLLMVGGFTDINFFYEIAYRDILEYVDMLMVSNHTDTRGRKVGVGKPTFQAIADLNHEMAKTDYLGSEIYKSAPMIVTDEVYTPVDMLKALGAGASFVVDGLEYIRQTLIGTNYDPYLTDLDRYIKKGILRAGFKNLCDFIGNAKFQRVTQSF